MSMQYDRYVKLNPKRLYVIDELLATVPSFCFICLIELDNFHITVFHITRSTDTIYIFSQQILLHPNQSSQRSSPAGGRRNFRNFF